MATSKYCSTVHARLEKIASGALWDVIVTMSEASFLENLIYIKK
jgi:hypothetical protein